MDETTRILLDIQKSCATSAATILYLQQSFDDHKETIMKKVDDHIIEDQRLLREHIVPLLQQKEQDIGADKQQKKTQKRYMVAFSILMPIASLIAGIFGGKISH